MAAKNRLYLYVRFSSSRQRDGNSVRRQMDYGADYCQKHGLSFDAETSTYRDEGVSGHKGANHRGSRAGGLADFLAACRNGAIPRGSHLLVESLDRLSREHPMDAMQLLRQLLSDYGITLAIIRPDMRITAGTLGQLEGIMWFIESMRAYSESAAKSDRSRYNWRVIRERAAAGEAVIGSRLPGWCHVIDGKLALIPERAEVVSRIFDMAAKGDGCDVIVKRMRREGVQPINRSNKWYPSYVSRLLRSRSVLGEWQPRLFHDGKLVPTGPPIANYYPAAVTQDQWDAARAAVAHRRNQAGRPSTSAVNLFTGLLTWAGGQACYRGRAGTAYIVPADDSAPGVRLEHLERAVLYWMGEVKLTDGRDNGVDALRAKESEIARSARQLESDIDADPSLVSMVGTLRKWKAQLAELRQQIEDASTPLTVSVTRSQGLIDRLAKCGDDERATLRRELRQAIRFIIKNIDIVADGKAYNNKTVNITVTLRGGEVRRLYYRTVSNRMAECGLYISNSADVAALLDTETPENSFKPDPVPFQRRGKPSGKYADVSMTRDEVAERVWQMTQEGKSAPQIAASLGINKFTVYRYNKQMRLKGE